MHPAHHNYVIGLFLELNGAHDRFCQGIEGEAKFAIVVKADGKEFKFKTEEDFLNALIGKAAGEGG